VTTLHAQVAGCLFARHSARWAVPGMEVAKIAGEVAFRTGPLLGA
jgi:predicted deacylase